MFLEYFFRTFAQGRKATFRGFRRIDRLVLNYGYSCIPVNEQIFRVLFWMYLQARDYFANLHGARSVVQGWISRVSKGEEPGWRLTLDFKEGLDPAWEGLWRLGEASGTFTADRLFNSRDYVCVNDDMESRVLSAPLQHIEFEYADSAESSGTDGGVYSEDETSNELDGSEEVNVKSKFHDGEEDEIEM
jgi:hypothetical protein